VRFGSGGRPESANPGKDRVSHAGRDAVRTLTEDLGDEKRVPIGLGMQLDRVEIRIERQLSHRSTRQRWDSHAADRRDRRKIAEQDGDRLRPIDIVAIRDNKQGPYRVHPPRQVLEQVQSRIVGQVGILDNHDRGGRADGQCLQACGEYTVSVALPHPQDDVGSQTGSNIGQRTERTERRQWLACAQVDRDVRRKGSAEFADQR
jgi:hypothetical protein